MTVSELKIGDQFQFVNGNIRAVYRGEGRHGSRYTVPGFPWGDDYVMECNSSEVVELICHAITN